MSLIVKLLISLLIAAIAATLTSVIQTGAPFQPLLLIAFAIVAVAATLLGNARGGPHGVQMERASEEPDTASGDREFGKVKWFNVSKGFGFIIKDDGDEIFVHFRSIRDGGRRGLRDGQRVSFVVADSDKGPQAEDVAKE